MNNNTRKNQSQPLIALDKPLYDESESGRKRPWAKHRKASDILAVAYSGIDDHKTDRLMQCAPKLLYSVQEVDGVKKIKLDQAWFCRVRLCPICQWRRSMKIYSQARDIIAEANKQAPSPKGYGWLMLTLTVRNVPGDELSQAITDMLKAWDRLNHYKRWQRAVKGTMRSLEVTHNLDDWDAEGNPNPWYNTYHPHIHTLICVPLSYFTTKIYITADEWQKMWRKAARLNYRSSLDIHRVDNRKDNGKIKEHKVSEMAKYTVKPGDYITPDDFDMMQETVTILDKALHKRRLVSYTGNLKEIHAKLHLDDIDDGDLVHTSQDGAGEDKEKEKLIAYSWYQKKKDYYLEVDKKGRPYLYNSGKGGKDGNHKVSATTNRDNGSSG